MSDDLNSLSVEALRGLLDGITGAKQFALAQAPEICQQLVLRGQVLGSLELAFAVALLITSCLTFSRALRSLKESAERILSGTPRTDWELYCKTPEASMPLAITCGLSGLIGLAIFCGSISATVTVFCAPKVFLMETLANMVRH